MKAFLGLLFLTWNAALFAHPGGGIIALSTNSAIIADSVENNLRLIKGGEEPKRLVSKFHGHWLTRGLDGQLYAEAFQESGGAWSSAAFRFDLSTGKLTEIAHRNELGALVFAVDRDGSVVFQRRGALVSRKAGRDSLFRAADDQLQLETVTAYAWSLEGDLVFADRNRIYRTDLKGNTHSIGNIEGTVLEPRIWNATDTPIIFGLAIDKAHRVLAAVPTLARVYRIGNKGTSDEIARGENGWRATGVAVFSDSTFLMESDSRASTSRRVRLLGPTGTVHILTVPEPSK